MKKLPSDMPIIDRLLYRSIDGRTVPYVGTPCREWIKRKNEKGYGQIGIGGKSYLTHKLMWEVCKGPVPIGLQVCHRCDNPSCVRLDHLFLGTNRDNAKDSKDKGRRARLKGSRHGRAKLTESDVMSIRSSSQGINDLAALYGVAAQNIRHIVQRKTWTHLP